MTVFNKTGHELAHLVKALRYKQEGRGSISNFIIEIFIIISGCTMNPGIDSNSNKNE